jgi:hypothetical protein
VRESSLKESEEQSSEGLTPLFSVALNEGGEAEKLFKRKRIDDLKLKKKVAKPHRPSDRRGVAKGLTRRRTREPIDVVHRQIGVGECKDYMHVEIVIRDFPI